MSSFAPFTRFEMAVHCVMCDREMPAENWDGHAMLHRKASDPDKPLCVICDAAILGDGYKHGRAKPDCHISCRDGRL